jgi:hypothetical protein
VAAYHSGGVVTQTARVVGIIISPASNSGELCHKEGAMSSIPIVPIQRLIQDVTGDLHVVVAANEQGFRETALEACLLAKEKLQAIREELLRPKPGIADPRYDYDS